MTIQESITRASARLVSVGIAPDEARTDARLLAQFAFAMSREALRMYPDRALSPNQIARYDALMARREKREPLAYITGIREFYGIAFAVTPAVLIPRPETEFVVEAVLRHINRANNGLKGGHSCHIADVGTGSGAIAVAVAVHAPPGTQVFASDLSSDAIAIARQNAEARNVADTVTCVHGDLLAPLSPFAPFAVIASNPPYIAPDEIETLLPEVRDWEPRIALGENSDALHFYRRLAREAAPLLAPFGLLVVEVGQGQDESVADLWRAAGLREVLVARDYTGIGRVVSGVKADSESDG